MPIYEFRCLKCMDLFELLVMPNDDKVEMKCPKCGESDFERVMSSTNYAVGGQATGGESKVSSQTRTCSSGSCTTYEIPGMTRS